MTQAIGSNSLNKASTVAQPEKPCYEELLERIQAIWDAVCMWICDLTSQLFSWETKKTLIAPPPVTSSSPSRNLAKQCFNAFRHMTEFLEPVEITQCEAVCKSWKDERLWQAQGANYKMTAPESGKFKDRFKEIHAMAFGKKAWKEHLKADPGITPHLPPQVYRVARKLQETHILTLIPKTVDGKPLSFNSFAPLAEKADVKLDIWPKVSEKYGSEPVAKAIWVWMQKDLEPGSRGKTQAQAEQDYPGKLGKALYYTISAVAHYARYKIYLFPITPQRWTYARTCDGGEERYRARIDGRGGDLYRTWCVLVGSSSPGILRVACCPFAYENYGVASLVPAHSV